MDIKKVFKRYKFRLSLTLFLILTEAFIGILVPLFIGYAIDGVINEDYSSIYYLGGLGVLLVIIGGVRRFMDSRFYAKIYIDLSAKLMVDNSNEVSKKTARLKMLNEITEFMENQIPELIQHTIGLFGVAFIILSLNTYIFLMGLAASLFVLIVYWLSSKKITTYNSDYNNELETQVNTLNLSSQHELQNHITRLTKINIKLSDLETVNFSLSWMMMIVFLLLAIVISVAEGITEYGALFALIMYVYQYIESVVSLPLFYQQWLRLKEIYKRINTF
ncbi:ABC transporter six-transmembrane domain-containing protein [Winogradskyella sp.]|uniref:ABC transporter six-transmembrane domain-containing protein n=1 Tax=Winogradskyella sp. TaxID=1883156 RepID=UPI0026049EA2|nr:ABC transporter six-transmembrane domain-containing protein [Winogradskyella sp.]